MDIALLRDFVAPVSTCFETEFLGNVWRLLQQTTGEQVAVIDRQQRPVGLLSLRRLLALILQKAPASPLELPALAAADAASMQQTLEDLRLMQQDQPLLEELALLPAQWTVDQFHPHLAEIDQRQWALVDAAGRYVGLLDRLRLLRFLAVPTLERQLAQSTGPPSFGPEPAAAIRPKAADVGLDPLLDLLERLPIPLMLQTAAGRVITQNLAWRQQIGELRDPNQVGREAASILEPANLEDIHRHYSSGEGSSWQGRSVDPHVINPYSDSWDSPVVDSDTAERTSFCRLSSEPNACVCVCPMKNGQERVWQFIRVPMGAAGSAILERQQPPAGVVTSLPGAAGPIEPAPAQLGFKLANLGFSPDPDWRFLAQTESLWLVLAQDMTEQQQVARELAAKNADLIQLNRLKDEFLACISHELKTPLTAVLGLSSLLKDQALGPLNDRQSRYAQLIYQSGRHLILVVNDILDLTRIETGQLELMLESVSIETVCTRAFEQSRQIQPLDVDAELQAGQSREEVRFTLEIQPGLTSIVADELRLRQMLVNLLSNAFKFTETTGEIGLKVEAWEGWVAFTVWDTGIGIPVDKQHLIFQKFQQLENPLTRRYEGTGLGLVLTQRLARLHGGDVTFTSVEGQGSHFTLILPPSPPQAGRAVAPPEPQTAITAGNRLVLVVEATHKLLEPLTGQLTALGYRVAIARSGTEALEKTRRLQPCLVFLNPLLPLLSGWDVLVLLKADEETQHIPVIVTAMRVEKDQAYQNGADGFLSLPIQNEALQACLDRFTQSTAPDAPEPLSRLTILHLHGSTDSLSVDAVDPAAGSNLSNLLHLHYCRVLEVDDLEQADLLARVWKPDVILVDGMIPDPLSYMQQLSDHPFLACLPLITLTAEVTHAANQLAGLAVYPCLHAAASASSSELPTLLQVIQHAVGLNWAPHILIGDFSELQANWLEASVAFPKEAGPSAPMLKPPVSLQALAQYLQIAGFRSSVEQSWESVLDQLQRQSVDVLLLCAHRTEPHPLLLEMAYALEQLEVRPPILVWQTPATAASSEEAIDFQNLWGAIATHLLPPTLSMPELLAQINQLWKSHPA